MSEGGAQCATHLDRQSVATCERCGRFTCTACAKDRTCLECQLRTREACPRPSRRRERFIGAASVAYAICTLLAAPALREIDWTKFNLVGFSGRVLGFTVINTIYFAVWVVLAASWLLWFDELFDWATTRGVELPGKTFAIVSWFIPVVNIVVPFMTMRKIKVGTATQTPLEVWWALTWLSLTLATSGGTRLFQDVAFTIASLLEVVAVLLCWRIVRDFRVADQQWDPRAQLALRG
jgi:hypothetical protein